MEPVNTKTMQHRDLILREIQRLARLLARLLGFKDEGLFTKAFALVDEACLELSGLTSGQLTALTDEDFLELIQEKELKEEQLEMLADILMAEGEMLREPDGKYESSQLRFRKAILLLNYLTGSRRQFSFERENKISRLRVWLDESSRS